MTYLSRTVKRVIFTGLTFAFLSSAAWADSIVLAGPVALSGFGFGNDPRALTIQSHGPRNNSEQGCIAPGLTSGSSACAPADGLVGGNESSPLGFPKQAAPTLSSLGITNGSQIGILFDAVQPQNSNNNMVTINDLTLKLYSGNTLEYSVSGMFSNLLTNPGNGSSDYLFELDPSAVASFDAALAGNLSDRIALDSEISFPNGSGGPESYTFVNVGNNSPIPEPSTLLLLGTGITGIAGTLRRRIVRS